MKFTIIGILIAAAVCGGIYVLSQRNDSSGQSSGGRPDANDIRSLKIN